MTVTNYEPLVSIVIPSFNQGEFIERTLKSVLSQNYKNIEIIVVDGMSSDNTIDVLKRFSDKIKYIHENDTGQSNAINKGFNYSKGDILTWLNSDDVYTNNSTISAVVSEFANKKRVDLIYGDFAEIDNKDNVLRIYMRPSFSFNRLLRCGYISQPTTFFKRNVFRNELLKEDLHLTMDTELWLRLSNEGYKFHHMKKLIAAERLHPDAKSISSNSSQYLEARDVRMQFGARFDKKHHFMRFIDKFVLYWFRIYGSFYYYNYDFNNNLNPKGSFMRTLSPFKIHR